MVELLGMMMIQQQFDKPFSARILSLDVSLCLVREDLSVIIVSFPFELWTISYQNFTTFFGFHEYINLPNIHQVVRSPAEDKSYDEDPCDFYCVNLGFSKHSTVVYFALLAGSGEDLGSPIDDNDDGDVTEHHHKER